MFNAICHRINAAKQTGTPAALFFYTLSYYRNQAKCDRSRNSDRTLRVRRRQSFSGGNVWSCVFMNAAIRCQ